MHFYIRLQNLGAKGQIKQRATQSLNTKNEIVPLKNVLEIIFTLLRMILVIFSANLNDTFGLEQTLWWFKLKCDFANCQIQIKLDGCILWNAYNTVFS